MRRILIVSPHFPPVNAPDAQRIRTALPYLRSLGWDPTILCVAPEFVDGATDEHSTNALPRDIRVERCAAWPLSISRRLGMRTLGMRAHRSMLQHGRRLIRELRPDLILFSTTQYLLVTLGPRWQQEFSVPYVVDLQDPWLTDYYEKPGAPKPPGGWKYRIARALAAHKEAPTFKAASGFVSVSPEYLISLGKRYPWFSSKAQSVIPFGVIPEEYHESVANGEPAFKPNPDLIQLVSIGAIGEIMNQALASFLGQVQQFKKDHPHLATRLRILFFGTSYAPSDQAKPSVMPLAAELGLDEIVQESTRRIPMSVAQATMQAADGLMILTSDDPAYSPSKLAGCFLANKPCLLVSELRSRASQICNELGLADILDSQGSTSSAFGKFYHDIANNSTEWIGRRNTQRFISHYTAKARTEQLAEFLDGICGATLSTQPKPFPALD